MKTKINNESIMEHSNVADLAPGSILQRMFFKQRMQKLFSGPIHFLEIGSGRGHLSELMLKMGHTGVGIDLNEEACQVNLNLNHQFIEVGKYDVKCISLFHYENTGSVFDLIFSSMVIEHLSPEELTEYFVHCRKLLKKNGLIIEVVPSSMKYWGIEDEIAGHYKRYTQTDFYELAKKEKLNIKFIAGLTYPVSNWLFPLSNRLVKKAEAYKQNLTLQERTILSGHRDVPMKSSFPEWMKIILNPLTLYPLFVLQNWFRNHKDCMVMYCEMTVD